VTIEPITIAIPYYQGIDYLREAIDSVLAQTSDAWQLVIVDDRGPESAAVLAGDYADPRIRFLENERNLGLAGNWNACVAAAATPWVTLLHNDDRLLPGYVEAVTQAIAAHPDVAIIFTDAEIIGPDGQPTRTLADRVKFALPRPGGDHELRGDEDLAGLLRGNYIVCPTMCLHREAVGADPFRADTGFVTDWELTTRILLEGGSLFGIREPLLEYRRHGNAETSKLTADASRFVEEFDLMRLRARECRELDLHRSAKAARRRTTVRGHLAVRLMLDILAGRFRAAKVKASLLWSDLKFGMNNANA
jgi:glycosyltransferase involved in cell wall biosynthesis